MSYATQSDVENIFGPQNIAAWSRYETGAPGGAADTSRIAQSLAYADSEINAHFANGPYALPLVCSVTKGIVVNWAATLAGVWLYGSRATASYVDYAGQRYLLQRNSIYLQMELYKAGVKRLDAPARFPHATSPSASV